MSQVKRFEDYCWHDNAIHGFRMVQGADGCTGDLVLDIDHIVEWLSPQDNATAYHFRVAPALLTFHEVSDLVVSIDYGAHSLAFQPMAIHDIQREEVTYPNGYTSFAWTIELNIPMAGHMTFQASGFTQTVNSESVISRMQSLSPSQRVSLLL
ncbi:MAG: hypothetical protein U5L74_03425 [Ideonella sp.]|nr:hypothetical protein [Ideonella sp.]